MSRKSRSATPDERALFEEVVDGKKPPAPSQPAMPPVTPPPSGNKARIRRPSGVDGRTAERLRKGEVEPDARLDLHGMTEAAAHRAVAAFLRSQISRRSRLLLIITGKGLQPRPPEAPFDLELDRHRRGILKVMVPRWLHEPEFVRVVADIRSAHRRHGGAGAFYVYLRKEQKSL